MKEAIARPRGVYLPEGTGPESGDGTESTSGSQDVEVTEGNARQILELKCHCPMCLLNEIPQDHFPLAINLS